jgi:hypothetical protein
VWVGALCFSWDVDAYAGPANVRAAANMDEIRPVMIENIGNIVRSILSLSLSLSHIHAARIRRRASADEREKKKT